MRRGSSKPRPRLKASADQGKAVLFDYDWWETKILWHIRKVAFGNLNFLFVRFYGHIKVVELVKIEFLLPINYAALH